MKFVATCETGGNGLWSDAMKTVSLTKLKIHTWDEIPEFGEARLYFKTKSWNVNKDGLVYTDKTFIKNFRSLLRMHGFSEAAAKDVDYSEQGMQGQNYISFDAGKKFIQEFLQYDSLTKD